MPRQSPRRIPFPPAAQTTRWPCRIIVLSALIVWEAVASSAAEPGVADAAPRPGRVYILRLPPPDVRPVSLQIEVRTANWDADADDDGVEMRVVPLSTSGQVVPLDGVLNVGLSAQKSRLERARENPWATLGTWSQRVRPQDFGAGGAVYRFPFQGVNPTLDRRFAIGRVDAALNSFRAGRLEASSELRLPRYDLRWGFGIPDSAL